MSDPVAAQLDAFNAHDLEAFAACYGADAVVEDARGAVTMRGHNEIRGAYGRLFERSPEARVDVVARTRVGEYVLDEERGTGFPQGDVHAVVVYHVAGDVIDHVRVIQ